MSMYSGSADRLTAELARHQPRRARPVERVQHPARVFERTDEPDTGKTGVNGNGRVQAGTRFVKRATTWAPTCECTSGRDDRSTAPPPRRPTGRAMEPRRRQPRQHLHHAPLHHLSSNAHGVTVHHHQTPCAPESRAPSQSRREALDDSHSSAHRPGQRRSRPCATERLNHASPHFRYPSAR